MAEENTTPNTAPVPEVPPTPTPTPAAAPAEQPPVSTVMKMPEGTVPAETKTNHLALIIGILSIVIALVLGGLYLWGAFLSAERMEEAAEEAMQNDEAEASMQSTPQPPEDSIDAIEADLNASNFESFETELNTIDAEIESETGAQ